MQVNSTRKPTAQSPQDGWENERFARHRLIPGWNIERLMRARVIIVGVGALGNEVSRILAMSGVGHMLLCDPDRVEASNLSRTILFREVDKGHLKVEAAARALREIAPGVSIETRPAHLVHGIGLAELRDSELVISCLDSRSSRIQLAGRCQLAGVSYVDGGTHPWGGEVRPYLDQDGPCYGCSLTPEQRAVVDAPWSCLDALEESSSGAAVPSSALVGTWMALVSIRFLMGLAIPSGSIVVDGSLGTASILAQTRDPECPLHRPIGPDVKKLNLSNNDTVGMLLEVLPEQSSPLAWDPVQYERECWQCGYRENYWGLPTIVNCPRCGQPLTPRTTLALGGAPRELKLSMLGIPPREIMPVRLGRDLIWVELS